MQLRAAGQEHIAAILVGLGYSCRQDAPDPGDILATGPTKLLVQVKTSLYPAAPTDPTLDELREMAVRAADLGYQAWFAKLRVNSIGAPVGEVIWAKVARHLPG